MTVRAPVTGLAEGERALDEGASHYLTRVLRLGAGATFVAFDPAHALEADAEIVRVDRADGVAIVRVGPPRAARVVAAREVTWIHALAKAEKCDAIVRDATELGATRVVLARTARSVVRLDETRARARVDRWSGIARDAARQSGRADPPRVEGPHGWDEAVLHPAASASRFVLHTSSAAPPLGPLLAAALGTDAALAFAAGPEGGLTDDEVASAERAGFCVASLGPFILRTETVCAAVLGAVRVMSSASVSRR